jgi:hypothetical protein
MNKCRMSVRLRVAESCEIRRRRAPENSRGMMEFAKGRQE